MTPRPAPGSLDEAELVVEVALRRLERDVPSEDRRMIASASVHVEAALRLLRAQVRIGSDAGRLREPPPTWVTVNAITTRQAAALLRCSEVFASRLARTGRVVAWRVGSGHPWQFDERDVMAYIAAKEAAA